MNHRISLAGGVAVFLALAPGALAQVSVEQFYKSKPIEMFIGYPPGGSNDVYARVLAQHLGKHIPGAPNIVVHNMPGAGSFLAANQVFAVSPKDGSVVAIGAPTLAIDEKLGTQGVRYKTAQFNWLGRISSLVNMVMTWHTVPVKNIADAQARVTTLAGTGAGSTVSIYPTVLNNVIGTKFKLIMGYRGSNEAMVAMERGETEGHSTSWEALKTAHPDWIAEKKVNVFVQFALTRHPELPDVPTAVELARNDEEKRILEAIMAASEVGTAFFTTPGAPADRVAALRAAFDKTMADPAFKADLEKVRVGLSPMKGEDLQKLVSQVANLPADLTEKVRAVYSDKQ